MQFVHMDLPFKVTVDLIEDAIEISDIRRDYLAARAGLYLAAHSREPGSLPPRGTGHSAQTMSKSSTR